jgi:tRNA modification GTPase
MVSSALSYPDVVHNRVRDLVSAIRLHLESSLRGSLLQTGIKTVLLGAPNVGKSSLINILAQRPASIVSPQPGTTRDVVEVLLDIGGFPCLVGDTAGLREGESVGGIEQEGVVRAKARADTSDLRILVVDVTRGNLEALHEILPYCRSRDEAVATILVLNKIDLIQSDSAFLVSAFSCASGIPEHFIFPISCLAKIGIADLASGIVRILSAMTGARDNVLATNERQRTLLKESQDHLQSFLGEYSLLVD